MTSADMQAKLQSRGQNQLAAHLEQCNDDVAAALAAQLAQIDLDRLTRLTERFQSGNTGNTGAMAARAQPPHCLVRLPRDETDRTRRQDARNIGRELLRQGRVGAILVAGGQGTRLGFDHPKGMYPVGPVSGATLFQMFFEQLLAVSKQAGKSIPYFIMTSDATDAETRDFLQSRDFFGYPADDVFFFKQGTMPAVDAATGRLLLSAADRLATSPDGHGGLLDALIAADLFDEMTRRGVDLLYYHQVDNPTAVVCDPVFLGFHQLLDSQVSTKVVAKVSAEERMGVAVDVDGKTQIIEYSDLPAEVAAATDEQGELRLWAGSTAMHVFDRDFLRQVAESDDGLPFHFANKKVPFVNEQGESVEPESPNAVKFERFIFDVLPLAETALVLETDRSREFNPVKNAEGNDSPATAKAALLSLHRQWLEQAGAIIDDGIQVELSPTFALDADEVADRIESGRRITEDTYFSQAPQHFM